MVGYIKRCSDLTFAYINIRDDGLTGTPCTPAATPDIMLNMSMFHPSHHHPPVHVLPIRVC